ncbi:hypothetical protein [Jannaschia donghaensis]|uniref:Uncharacterized protein n=1 Tax=Jannaschia donghaensis TaxID=420998 RepID=A0A0M6YG91_9RHOB|nr:hypothetical protein [Jannaschia donghaensis]CTQ49371.1 hypothetical protein JDO7802_01384 [Jannaschia donghaensis]
MEKIAYLVIGGAVAVIAMTLLPMGRIDMSSDMRDAEMPMEQAAMSEMGAVHQHPPREISPDLPMPGVTHLMFPDVIDGYNVQILTRNFTFTPVGINRPPKDNEGHAHIYVNGVKIARIYSDWYHLPDASLQPGENTVRVSLNANDHSEWAIGGRPIASVVRIQGADDAK